MGLSRWRRRHAVYHERCRQISRSFRPDEIVRYYDGVFDGRGSSDHAFAGGAGRPCGRDLDFLHDQYDRPLVPAITMVTSSVTPVHRGGFMSINSAVAQFSSATAAALAGCIIHDGHNHQLIGFGFVGWAYLGWAVIGLWLGARVRGGLREQPVAQVAEAV